MVARMEYIMMAAKSDVMEALPMRLAWQAKATPNIVAVLGAACEAAYRRASAMAK